MHLAEPPPICADCGSEDPQWGSLNRGVLVCTDCCYVHRNLGRYISHIRSIKKGVWEAAQLELIKLLHRSGSNRIWEHALTQPQFINTVRKPLPNDPLFPTKETFIKQKYVDQAFTIKQGKDDDPFNIEDLNRQLWSCVRASHVDTTLRLLVLGADPNYCDHDKQNTPLHVAAKEGQALQVELLCIYGAFPNAKNGAHMTPAQVARLEGHNELANRLEELCFEMTNRLSLFLCGRKPNHTKGQHFLIPDLVGRCSSEELRAVKISLRSLPLKQFEKLVQDVYDEVDRRETAAQWAAIREKEAIHLANEQCVAVFLPLVTSMPATRNQLRQKLAKYNTRQFASLTIDVLREAKRRFLGEPKGGDEVDGAHGLLNSSYERRNQSATEARCFSNNRDYDDVADYQFLRNSDNSSNGPQKMRTSEGNQFEDDRVPFDDVLELKERVSECENSLSQVLNANAQILKKLNTLQATVDRYHSDNVVLKEEVLKMSDHHAHLSRRMPSPSLMHNPLPISNNANKFEKHRNVNGGSESLSESRMGIRHGSLTSTPTTAPPPRMIPSGRASVDHQRERERMDDRIEEANREIESRINNVFPEACFPDNLIRETECLTSAIRQLLSDAQRGMLSHVAEKHAFTIASLIQHIIQLIPLDVRTKQVNHTVNALAEATAVLSAKCNSPLLDCEETCHAAYDVAKAAKSLLMAVHD